MALEQVWSVSGIFFINKLFLEYYTRDQQPKFNGRAPLVRLSPSTDFFQIK